jgi:hypothetical protein
MAPHQDRTGDCRFAFDAQKMVMISLDPAITILQRNIFGNGEPPTYHVHALNWNGHVYCFRAQIDYVRDASGAITKIDEVGRPSGLAWRNVKLHGSVLEDGTNRVYYSETIQDKTKYYEFAQLVIEFLSVNRFIRNNPPVALITFDKSERFEPDVIELPLRY